ncbi:glycosyl hydrolase [Umbelopsis sp. AD052]|nr:glycosyl hydrolase [Umbelopsis sp. AD052]
MPYQNPILPGFHPDPSICRVGEDYYLVNSTFEFWPGIPIYHSKNLVDWKLIGHVLTRKTQLSLSGVASSGGVWAPTIRHHEGKFYVIVNALCYYQPGSWKTSRTFYCSTSDINSYGSWSEPIYVNQKGIDPSLLFHDGKAYITSQGVNNDKDIFWGIYQSEIDIETGRHLTERKQLWKGHTYRGTSLERPEGPHLYHIDDWYYLLLAEGGTEERHMVTCARSKDPYGPWEECPGNPLVHHYPHSVEEQPIRCTGHGDLFQDHLGDWWIVFLGTRRYPDTYDHLGRETFLAPVEWQDGWPVINQGNPVSLKMDVHRSLKQDGAKRDLSFEDNFDEEELDKLPSWVGRRQQSFRGEFRTLMDFKPKMREQEAGLTLHANDYVHAEIGITFTEEHGRTVFSRVWRSDLDDLDELNIEKKREIITYEALNDDEPVELFIKAEPTTYSFGYKNSKSGECKVLGIMSTKWFKRTQPLRLHFTGVYVAMFCTDNGYSTLGHADFDYFKVTAEED